MRKDNQQTLTMFQMLKLPDKDFKAAIINVFNQQLQTHFKQMEI